MESKEIIKELRKSHGYTVEQVATGADIPKSVYPKYESGILNAGVPVLIKLADFYGVSVDYLLGREKDPEPLEQLASQKSMEITETTILEKYLNLPEQARKLIIQFLKDAIKEAENHQNNTSKISKSTSEQATYQKKIYTCGELEDMRKAKENTIQDVG